MQGIPFQRFTLRLTTFSVCASVCLSHAQAARKPPIPGTFQSSISSVSIEARTHGGVLSGDSIPSSPSSLPAVAPVGAQAGPSSISSISSPITLPILTFHYVEQVKDKADHKRATMAVLPSVFEKQITALKNRGIQTVFVRDIPSLLSASTPSKSIAITFDDGYEDFYTNVLPLLQQYKVKATLFVVNDFIDKPGYVSAAEIREILASGLVEIGAHTMHHKNLTNLLPGAAGREISQSRQGLENQFTIAVTSFAYPYGKHSAKIEKLVEQAGFTAAVTTDRGFVQSPRRLFTLKRIPAGAFLGSRKWKAIGMAP